MINPENKADDYNLLMVEELSVPENLAGQRLDVAISRLLPQYSRNCLQGWIKAGALKVDGMIETECRKKLLGGETLTLKTEESPAAEKNPEPEDIALDVVFEDASLFVINKPAGLVAHPGNGNWHGTLLNALLHRDPGLKNIPRAGIVHRLDKETSGLLVIARTLKAQTALVRQLQSKSVWREYWAVAQGRIAQNGSIFAPIGRHPTQRVKMAVVPERGKEAVTHYQVLRRYPNATLLRCRLETGRTHQIRVHMAHLGHPLLGDPLYGRHFAGLPRFHRQALHAIRLGLTHPESGLEMFWEAPLPDDLKALQTELESG